MTLLPWGTHSKGSSETETACSPATRPANVWIARSRALVEGLRYPVDRAFATGPRALSPLAFDLASHASERVVLSLRHPIHLPAPLNQVARAIERDIPSGRVVRPAYSFTSTLALRSDGP